MTWPGDEQNRSASPGRVFMAESEDDLALLSRQLGEQTPHEIQQRLLPNRCPQTRGFDIAASSTPAIEEVGGDHYNFHWAGHDQLGIVVADVSGKGLTAALTATLLRATFRTQTWGNHDVRDVLSRVNAFMQHSLRRGMFVTCCYGLLELSARRFTWARAGHEPLIVTHANGSQTDILSPAGFPLGILGSPDFRHALEVKTIALRPGDHLLMFTDGLTEAMNAHGEEFGMQRILYALQGNGAGPAPRGSAQAQLDALHAAVRRHVGAQPLSDDLTMVSITVE